MPTLRPKKRGRKGCQGNSCAPGTRTIRMCSFDGRSGSRPDSPSDGIEGRRRKTVSQGGIVRPGAQSRATLATPLEREVGIGGHALSRIHQASPSGPSRLSRSSRASRVEDTMHAVGDHLAHYFFCFAIILYLIPSYLARGRICFCTSSSFRWYGRPLIIFSA
jgi:hypothetical protein